MTVFGDNPRMVFHLATERGYRAVTKHLWYRPNLNDRVRALRYEDLLDHRDWQAGVYLFTDSERMSSAQRNAAEWLHARLSEHPESFVVLNHPTRHVARYELLRSLFQEGANLFNVHRLHAIDEARYPLFLRYENRHIGSMTPLLRDRGEVDRWITDLAATGEDIDSVIAVEFEDCADEHGLYRKYGAFRVGDKIVPRHMFVSTHWEVKIDTNNLSAFRRREEYAYLRENPHEKEVMEAFEKAGLQYGRIDYAVKDGKLQVWEINDNPQMTSGLLRYWRGRLGRCLYSLKGLDDAFLHAEARVASNQAKRIDLREFPDWRLACTP